MFLNTPIGPVVSIVRVALIVSDSYHHYSGSGVLITLLIGLLTSGDKKLYRLVATGPSLLSSLLNELIDRAASELVVISADRNLPIRTLTSHLPDSSYRKIITPLNLKFGLIEHFEMHFISDLQKVTFKLHFPSKAQLCWWWAKLGVASWEPQAAKSSCKNSTTPILWLHTMSLKFKVWTFQTLKSKSSSTEILHAAILYCSNV